METDTAFKIVWLNTQNTHPNTPRLGRRGVRMGEVFGVLCSTQFENHPEIPYANTPRRPPGGKGILGVCFSKCVKQVPHLSLALKTCTYVFQNINNILPHLSQITEIDKCIVVLFQNRQISTLSKFQDFLRGARCQSSLGGLVQSLQPLASLLEGGATPRQF